MCEEKMTDNCISPERKRLDAWSAENPRDDLGLVAIAAWLNVAPEKLPKEMRLHTCAATKEAWARVASALTAALAGDSHD
jgi:3-methyladenine DNA glycosylase/8-oxoguanine DNA glycosylase